MRLSHLTATILGGALLVAACGGASEASQSPATGSPVTSAPPAAVTAAPTDASVETPPAAAETEIAVESVDSAFNTKTITAPANTEITVTLNNTGELPHDIAFFDKEGGNPLAESAVSTIIQGGETTSITFTTPGPGTYFFVCLVHPVEMTGAFVVK